MWDIVGHSWAVKFLENAIASGHVAHSDLFLGPPGIGKADLAVQLASALNCTGAVAPCGDCVSCRKTRENRHPDLVVVEPDAGRIKIDRIRSLQYELALSPHGGRWRVCVLTEFESATVEAANALLKTLEEPPRRAILILCATDARQLLPTIVSRCQTLALRMVPVGLVLEALIRWGAEPDMAERIARASAGRVGWARRALADNRVLSQRQESIDALLRLLDQGDAERILAAEKLAVDQSLEDTIHVWQSYWRDVALVSSGCVDLITNAERLESLTAAAATISMARVHAALRGTEDFLKQLNQNVNRRLALEVLLLGWSKLDADDSALSN